MLHLLGTSKIHKKVLQAAMERRRFNRNLSNGSRKDEFLQKKLAESKATTQKENAPDLTDFMNDMFFGTINTDNKNKKVYNLTGTGSGKSSRGYRDDEDFDSSIRSNSSNSSRLTQEWLVEAKRLVAASPTRHESPSKRIGSPRFGKSKETTLPISSSILVSRDPLSRSARRHRALESFSGEILSKTAKHNRNKSETTILEIPPSNEASPAQPFHAVQKWISNIILAQQEKNSPTTSDHHSPLPPILSPRQSTGHRKSRFQAHQRAPPESPTQINQPIKRDFKISNPNNNGTQLLSPPRDFSGSLEVISPPRNLIVSAQRRSVSSSTCRNAINTKSYGEDFMRQDLNGFLKEQRREFEKIMNGEKKNKAKIVLSGPSNSSSSMVAAICYAWLIDNRMKATQDLKVGDENSVVVVPVMSTRRGNMWKQRQSARLFHHVGIDATALLFSDEVELETLMMAKQLSILVVGEDILKTNGEVSSKCTILTDNYCEEAYDLLQTSILKKLLLAGILVDTQNLDTSGKTCTNRDAEAVQLLLVGSTPNFRSALYDQITLDNGDSTFVDAMRYSYGEPNTARGGIKEKMDKQVLDRDNRESLAPIPDINSTTQTKNSRSSNTSSKQGKSTPSPLQPPAAAAAKEQADTNRGKNKFFFAKWFGFGSK